MKFDYCSTYVGDLFSVLAVKRGDRTVQKSAM
jgi:hypothetical protein